MESMSKLCFMSSTIDHDCKQSILPSARSNRFLINIFEPPVNREMNKLPSNDNNNCRPKETDSFATNKRTMDQFVSLRKQRDIECLKLNEASKIHFHLNKSFSLGHWAQRLVAEKILLESGKAVELLKNKIGADYISAAEKEPQIAVISLSDFKFHVDKVLSKSSATEFFVLLLINKTDVKATKIARAFNGEIEFPEEFNFAVSRNFAIQVQLYSIVMRDAPRWRNLIHKDRQTPVVSKVQYMNVNTCNFEESKIVQTRFSLCAETELTPDNFHGKAWELKVFEKSGALSEFLSFCPKVKSFKIEYQKRGFLTLGTMLNGTVIWNRRWCVLDGNLLKIYSAPEEEDDFDPQLVVDLIHCPSGVIAEAPSELCNRRRSIMLKIKENGIVCEYFLMADNAEDVKVWIHDLNVILDFLKFKSSFRL